MGISALSLADVAQIKAAWYALTDEKFQCTKIFEKLSQRNDAEVVIQVEKNRRGCGVFTAEPKVVIDNQIGFHTCLCNPDFHHPNMSEILFLFENYKRGVLPYNGTLTEQPAQLMEIFQLIENLHFEREQKTQEAAQSKAKAQAPTRSPRKK